MPALINRRLPPVVVLTPNLTTTLSYKRALAPMERAEYPP